MKTVAKAQVPGLTKARNPIQIVALLAVSIITVLTLYLAAVVGAVTVGVGSARTEGRKIEPDDSEVVLGRKLYLARGIRGVGTSENWRRERADIILVIRMVQDIESINAQLQLGDAAPLGVFCNKP